jgi:ubiquinone/menaquinone biosynthesis C-methylase UbiE
MVDAEKIKEVVCANFDESANKYDQFECNHGLFSLLTERLASETGIGEGMTIYDIGCGTGVSTMKLAELVGKGGRVMGVDFSPEMLKLARAKPYPSNIEYVEGDATELDVIKDKGDSVLYNASIFLIPDPEKVLRAAYGALRPGGIVGMNWLEGVFDANEENDLFRQAKDVSADGAPYGRRIVKTEELAAILEHIGFRKIKQGSYHIEMPIDHLREFFSIPAQSAGLYPRNTYGERLGLLDKLIKYLVGQGHQAVKHKWAWLTAIK